MLRRWVVVTFLIVTSCPCLAGAAFESGDKTLLWEIRSPHRTMYVVGDTRALTAADYPLPRQFEEAFRRSGEVVLEGDFQANEEEQSALVRQYGLLQKPEKLIDELDASQTELVTRSFRYALGSMDQVEGMRPWLAVLTLVDVSHRRLGSEGRDQVMDRFYRLAEERKIPVSSVERGSEQIKMFADMPEALQVEWLVSTTMQAQGSIQEQEAARPRIVSAWRHGDVMQLADAAASQFSGRPELYAVLVAHRNAAWLGVLESKLARSGKPVFVAVGAGHLVGPDNLIDMLQQAGYSITQK